MIAKQSLLQYVSALILSSKNKKTCASLAPITLLRSDKMLALLEEMAPNKPALIKLARHWLNRNSRWWIIVDDTLINKRFSKIIQGTSLNYDSATGTHYISLCTVVILVTDGHIVIPIDHHLWIEKALAGAHYETKIEIAKKLIREIAAALNIEHVLADGLYASVDFITWANEQKLKVDMRFHANRKIRVDNEEAQVRHYFAGRKNSKRVVFALWKGLLLTVTKVIRYTKTYERKIVYQVANYYAGNATTHRKAYDRRWAIERFFRTAKQHLGMTDCQSRKKIIQENHIRCVFLAYAFLQVRCKIKKLLNPESAISYLKSCFQGMSMLPIMRSDLNFDAI